MKLYSDILVILKPIISREIVFANGKSGGEMLLVGDRIHLKNKFPNGGYFDSGGWVKAVPLFKTTRIKRPPF